jgi:hypothetical protein
MRRRGRHDPLQPNAFATWLVVRNPLSQVVESKEIEPGSDLRAVLAGARADRISSGWVAEELGDRLAFFFCERSNERLLVSIEFRQPPPIGERW